MDGQAYDEGRAFAGFAAGGDGTAMTVGDAAADGQAHAGAFVFAAAMEALEHGEDFVGVLFVEADAVVLDREFAELIVRRGFSTAGKWFVDELGGDFDLRDVRGLRI